MTAHRLSLKTRRLRIEPFDEHCISHEYIGWLNDSEIMRFSNQRLHHHTEETARGYLTSFAGTSNILLAIRLALEDRMIGTMTAFVSAHHGTADMGLLIGDRGCWGQGYGLEAWNAVMCHLFESRGLRKVTGGALRSNIGMVKIMERSGMQLEAVRERQEILDGEALDVLYFARFVDC